MFYAEQLSWNSVNGTLSTAQNYSLNFGASSCQPSLTSNGNYSSITYVKIKEFLNKIKRFFF